MKRLVTEALAAYALCVALELLILRDAGAQLWGGLLGLNVFAASFLAGWAHLRRIGDGPAPGGVFWLGASCGIGFGLALGALGAANALYAVAAKLPDGRISLLLLAGIFVFGACCARMVFWALETGRALPEMEEAEPSA